jgi:hypothetical protein
VVQDSNVSLVYMDYRNGTDYEVYFQRSTDAGVTWADETRLTSDPGISNNPCLAASGDNLYVAYDDQRGSPCRVYYRRSTDRGGTWEPEVPLTANTYYPAFPCIVANGDYVHLAWMDWRVPRGSVYYRRSTDRGATWEAEVGLVLVDSFTYSPCLAAEGARVHLTWNDYRFNDAEIFYKHSDDNGAHWDSDVRLTDAWGLSQDPNIAVAGNNVYVVFDENQGQWDIMFTMSSDGGSTWTTPMFLCQAPNRSFYPSIATDGLALHVVWHDLRDGNREIYYKRNPNGVGAEERSDRAAQRSGLQATVVRDVIRIQTPTSNLRFVLSDACGRMVMALHPGPNDARHLPPGIYFVRPASGVMRGASGVARIAVLR